MKKIPEWMLNPPDNPKEIVALLKRKAKSLKKKNRVGRLLRRLLKDLNHLHAEQQEAARSQDPLAFFKPSYDQSLILNAWIWGIGFLCVYTANRIGKTTAIIINILLWLYPNEIERWSKRGIFRTYRVGEDPYDRQNADNPNRGKLVEILPRPNVEAIQEINDYIVKHNLKPNPMLPHYVKSNAEILQRLQKALPHCYEPCYPYSPWSKGGTIWMGAPDHPHHKNIIMPLWKQYIPAACMDRFAPSDQEFTFRIPGQKRTTVWEWVGKSYDSKDTKWSSGAVDIIHLTEGVTPSLLKEVKARFKDPGIGAHDFTPYEATNVGSATALAKRIKQGREEISIPYYVFEGFSVYDAPLHIISKNKKAGLIKAYKNDPEGRARLEGHFYSNSALILSNLDRHFHLLEWTKEELFQRYPTGRLYRGLDPGWDHPTACVWALLTPQNQWIVYRIFKQRGLSVSERAKVIIELSNNQQQKIFYGPRPTDFYLVETHEKKESEIITATPTDFHIFEVDQTTGKSFSMNFLINGLNITESTHMRPEPRAAMIDEQLKPSPFLPHIAHPLRRPPGAQVYFLRQEMGILDSVLEWEDLYWDRYKGGELKGEPKDKVPTHGDDSLDALCYITCGEFRWTKHAPKRRLVNEPVRKELAQFAQEFYDREQKIAGYLKHNNQQQGVHTLQPLQSQNRQSSHFGTPEQEDEQEYPSLQSRGGGEDSSIDFNRY